MEPAGLASAFVNTAPGTQGVGTGFASSVLVCLSSSRVCRFWVRKRRPFSRLYSISRLRNVFGSKFSFRPGSQENAASPWPDAGQVRRRLHGRTAAKGSFRRRGGAGVPPSTFPSQACHTTESVRRRGNVGFHLSLSSLWKVILLSCSRALPCVLHVVVHVLISSGVNLPLHSKRSLS